MEQPGFSAKLVALPTPQDLPSLRQALTMLARECLSMMSQPGYLPLVRMIIAEAPRFPQLGTLFFPTVTERGLAIITALLRAAREQQIIADIDFDAVTHTFRAGVSLRDRATAALAAFAAPPGTPCAIPHRLADVAQLPRESDQPGSRGPRTGWRSLVVGAVETGREQL
jgi:hypothetical protein